MFLPLVTTHIQNLNHQNLHPHAILYLYIHSTLTRIVTYPYQYQYYAPSTVYNGINLKYWYLSKIPVKTPKCQ